MNLGAVIGFVLGLGILLTAAFLGSMVSRPEDSLYRPLGIRVGS